ncbi:ABC transporter permease [bacterium]|nr:ABC transporter permease [bacterium]
MFINYLRASLRNILKHKTYSFINVFGLTIGMAVSLLIMQYVWFEYTYDKMIPDYDRAYKISLRRYQDNVLKTNYASIYPAVAPAVKSEVPEIESAGRLIIAEGVILVGDQKYIEPKIYHADASIPEIFGLHMLAGDQRHAIEEPATAMISESLAKKYFGSVNVIGKTIQLSSGTMGINILETYEIRGVFQDRASHTHFPVDILFSYKTYTRITAEPDIIQAEESWTWADFHTYIKLKPNADLANVQAKLKNLINKYRGERLRQRNMTEEWVLRPVREIHLKSGFLFEAAPEGNATMVNILALVGLFVLGIGWINYINLTTARATERAKEVGIRKTAGATRSDLLTQFVIESLVLNAFAFVLALIVVEMSFPYVAHWLGISADFTGNELFWSLALLTLVIGSGLSSIYPALILSSFQPVTILKGRFKNSAIGIFLRKGLLTFQFAAAMAMIAATLIVYQQIMFMRNQQLGFEKDQTMIIRSSGSQSPDQNIKAERFKTALHSMSSVRGSTVSMHVPGDQDLWATPVRLLESDRTNTMFTSQIDKDFLNNYKIPTIAGRAFSKEFADARSVLINREALRMLDMINADDAINRKIIWVGDTLTIAGVVENVHQRGLQKPYDPMIYRLIDSEYRYFSIQLDTDNLPATIEGIGKIYTDLFPADAFNYFFLDDFFDAQYRADERFGVTFGFFSLLAIGVASMGLLGLIMFTAHQRTREIGIRKVLGASVSQISLLLCKEFTGLFALALAITVPVVWYSMSGWLLDYAFRITIGPLVFVAAALIGIVIVGLTISYFVTKAARANPVEALKYE